MSLALDQHPLVQDTVGPQCSIRIEVFAINRTPAPGSGPPRSAFHYLVDLLRITRSGSEQFHARLWLTNATRLSGMEWLGLRREREWVTGGSRCRINQETVRIYIIGNDGITLCRGALATVNEGETTVASKEELHAAQRQAAAGTVEYSTRRRETTEGWRPRGADRSAVVGG